MVAARALDYWATSQQLDLGLGGVAVAVKDRKGDCCGAIGMTVQLQSLAGDAKVQALLGPLRDAVQALRPIL